MKKYIIGLSIAAFTFMGCSDFLDEPIRGQQDLSEYFKNSIHFINTSFRSLQAVTSLSSGMTGGRFRNST